MSTIFNNVSIRLNGASYKAGIPIPIGSIFRITNFSGSSAFSENYTNIYNQTLSTNNLSQGQSQYILTKSGSLNPYYDGTGITGKLFAFLGIYTTNANENLNFTEQIITTVGAGSWIKPSGVTQVIVQCFGAGGAGGAATLNNEGGSGGGGGAYAQSILTYGTAQQSISYSIGEGGIGGSGTGGTGGDTTWNTNQVIAKGATGGEANFFGIGGETLPGSVGDIVIVGGTGGSSFNDGFGNIGQGIGGISGGSNVYVFGADQTLLGYDLGGLERGGNFTTISLTGTTGNLYGGGGSPGVKFSGPTRNGGSGAQGVIRLIYR